MHAAAGARAKLWPRVSVSWIPGLLLALGVMAALRLALGDADWTEGEGVYALTARMLLHGADLYGHVVVAQPPGTVLAGAASLAVRDSLAGLRNGISILQIASALACGQIVWRLTESRPASVLTPAITLLTPWAVHENSTLLPETVGMPLLLCATLQASKPGRHAAFAGALAMATVFVKYPMVVPLVALGVAARDRRLYAIGAIACGAALAIGSAVIFTASGIWQDTVLAQSATSNRSVHLIGTIALQAIWNSGVIVVLAAVAVVFRRDAADRALWRTSSALALAMLLTAATMVHQGTGLYVLATVELACLPLAVSAGVWNLRRVHFRATAAVLVAVCAFVLWQSASLLISPSDPKGFVRPGAPPGFGAGATTSQVNALVASARRCPKSLAYSGTAFVAFIAEMRMPGDQPDPYIISHSTRLQAIERAAQADQPRCP